MILTKEQLEKIVVPFNMVVVRLPQAYGDMLHSWYSHQMKDEDKTVIKIDTSFDPAMHAPRWGEVYRSPRELVYERDDPASMGWKTEVDIKDGDVVFFDYLSCLTALGKLANPGLSGETPSWIRVDNELYIVMRYDALIFAFREDLDNPSVGLFGTKGNIICLNGNMIIRPVFNEVKSSLIIPEHLKREENRLVCDVVYAGRPNSEYLDGVIETDEVQPGHRVVLKNFKLRIENSLANILSPDLAYVQRKSVWAIIN